MRISLVFVSAIGFCYRSFRCEIACVYSAPMTRRRIFLSLLLCALSGSAVAQDRVAAAVESLPAIKKIDQVAISPDGTKVAYIVEGELSVAGVSGGVARRIEHKLAAREVTWSADSREIAWLGD